MLGKEGLYIGLSINLFRRVSNHRYGILRKHVICLDDVVVYYQDTSSVSYQYSYQIEDALITLFKPILNTVNKNCCGVMENYLNGCKLHSY